MPFLESLPGPLRGEHISHYAHLVDAAQWGATKANYGDVQACITESAPRNLLAHRISSGNDFRCLSFHTDHHVRKHATVCLGQLVLANTWRQGNGLQSAACIALMIG